MKFLLAIVAITYILLFITFKEARGLIVIFFTISAIIIGFGFWMINKNEKKSFPKYPPTDTLGGWD